MRARDPFRLVTWEARVEASHRLKAYPRPLTLRRLLAPIETQAFAGSEVARAKGDGVEYADIRDFVPGDRVRSINWRASARRQGLVVNERHPERNTDVVLFVDSFADVRDGDRSVLDDAVRAAASLAARYLERRDRVGLVGFGGVLRWLQPGMGATQRYRLIETMLETGVEPTYTWRDVNLIPARILPPAALVLALTPLVDPRFVAALEDLRGRRFDVAVVEVDPVPLVEPGRIGGRAARVPPLAPRARGATRAAREPRDRRRDLGRRRARHRARGGEDIQALRATGTRLATGVGSVACLLAVVARADRARRRDVPAGRRPRRAPSPSSRSSRRSCSGWSPLVPVGDRARRVGSTPPSSRSTTRRSTSPRRSSPPGSSSCAELAYWSLDERSRGAGDPGEGLRRAAFVALLGGRARSSSRALLLALVDAVRARGLALDLVGAIAAVGRRRRRCSRRARRERQPSSGS